QGTFLVYRALHFLATRALRNVDKPLTRPQKRDLDKIIILRTLLAPISEGLALYAQYDYCPANFYGIYSPRSTFGGLIEFIIAKDHNSRDHKTADWLEQLKTDVHEFYLSV